mmetsp:Transcript_80582/g.261129  ORF Transcript_80582/g.261129 Transcript_80582/m.261129 type:complete len:287 (+) Transcript_80582:1670-2530(+)
MEKSMQVNSGSGPGQAGGKAKPRAIFAFSRSRNVTATKWWPAAWMASWNCCVSVATTRLMRLSRSRSRPSPLLGERPQCREARPSPACVTRVECTALAKHPVAGSWSKEYVPRVELFRATKVVALAPKPDKPKPMSKVSVRVWPWRGPSPLGVTSRRMVKLTRSFRRPRPRPTCRESGCLRESSDHVFKPSAENALSVALIFPRLAMSMTLDTGRSPKESAEKRPCMPRSPVSSVLMLNTELKLPSAPSRRRASSCTPEFCEKSTKSLWGSGNCGGVVGENGFVAR